LPSCTLDGRSRNEQQYWVHLRTTNLIESTFARVRLRTRGPGAWAVEITPELSNRTPEDRSRLTTPDPHDLTIPPGPDLLVQTIRPVPLVIERGGSVHPHGAPVPSSLCSRTLPSSEPQQFTEGHSMPCELVGFCPDDMALPGWFYPAASALFRGVRAVAPGVSAVVADVHLDDQAGTRSRATAECHRSCSPRDRLPRQDIAPLSEVQTTATRSRMSPGATTWMPPVVGVWVSKPRRRQMRRAGDISLDLEWVASVSRPRAPATPRSS